MVLQGMRRGSGGHFACVEEVWYNGLDGEQANDGVEPGPDNEGKRTAVPLRRG
jgi:hypothetical protein